MAITVQDAVRLSHLSYEAKKEAEYVASKEGYSRPELVVAEDTQCLIAEKDDDVICAFRGTEPTSIQDWIGNLDAKKVDSQFGPGKLHRGFCNELEAIWPLIIDRLIESGRPIHLVGHSKGGALANIAAMRMRYYRDASEVYVWTFGAPRCLTSPAAEALEKWCAGILRVVNYVDPVPWFPRNWWGFRHAGVATYFRNGKHRLIIENPPYVVVWGDAVGQLAKYMGRWRHLVADYHAMIMYTLEVTRHFGGDKI